jgi:hypothetical protein
MAGWSDIQDAVQQLYGDLPQAAGETPEALARAEGRLGVSLPSLLRRFYLRFGRFKSIAGTQDYLLAPDRLRIESGTLVFCVENQSVHWWGIRCPDLLQENPPVYRSEYLRFWQWDTDQLSDFLTLFVFRQAVLGGLPNSGTGTVRKAAVATAEKRWREVPLGRSRWDTRVFVADGQALYWVEEKEADGVFAATRRPEDLWTIARLLEVEWHYAETEDGGSV